MRLDVVTETVAERIVRALNLAPVPLVHTHVALLLARAVMEATRAGVFDAAAGGPATASEVAGRCRLDETATEKLLGALTTSGYFAYDSRSRRYALTPMSRKWLLAAAPASIRDKLLFQFIETAFIDRMGEYLRSGRDVTGGGHLGESQTPDFWSQYQRAMRAVAAISAPEVARRTFVPRHARTMLDIGGSHGLFSAALCRRHPGLRSTIVDLPEAVAAAAPLLAAEGLGDRVRHEPGNVLVRDLGEGTWDLVFVSQLAHHFDGPTNRLLMARIARALTPGGAVVIQEMVKRSSPTDGGQPGALLDLYFALTSEAGTWSVEEIAAWQRDAGLAPRRPIRLRTMPVAAQQTAVKSAARERSA